MVIPEANEHIKKSLYISKIVKAVLVKFILGGIN